jgi:hypothetical protein
VRSSIRPTGRYACQVWSYLPSSSIVKSLLVECHYRSDGDIHGANRAVSPRKPTARISFFILFFLVAGCTTGVNVVQPGSMIAALAAIASCLAGATFLNSNSRYGDHHARLRELRRRSCECDSGTGHHVSKQVRNRCPSFFFGSSFSPLNFEEGARRAHALLSAPRPRQNHIT